MHLFVSFMLRAVSIFIKDKVVHTHIGVKELEATLMGDIKSIMMTPVLDKSQYVSQQNNVLCILTLCSVVFSLGSDLLLEFLRVSYN